MQEWAGHSRFSTTADIYTLVLAGSKNRLAQSIDSALLEPIGSETVRKRPARARGKKEENPENAVFSRFFAGGAYRTRTGDLYTARSDNLFALCAVFNGRIQRRYIIKTAYISVFSLYHNSNHAITKPYRYAKYTII